MGTMIQQQRLDEADYRGVKTVEVDLNTLRKYIDWTPFFLTWALAGKYPRILNDEVVGNEAKSVFKDANDMLDSLCASKKLKAKGRVGIFRANSQGKDVLVFSPGTHDDANAHINNIQNLTGSHISVAHHLRQQTHKPKGPNYCLSDFVMPLFQRRTDYMGAGASVSGWYFAHPESRFFAVAKIQQDQLKDYAQRKGWSTAEAEKWLTPNLND